MKIDNAYLQEFWAARNEQFRRAVAQPAIVRRAMQMISRDEARARILGGFAIGFEEAVVAAYLQHVGEIGEKFLQGRKRNTVGPVRLAIRRELKRDPSASTETLWTLVAQKPPRGWAFFDNRQGRYIEGPRAGQNMSFRTFGNAASKERKLLENHGIAPP
ncbi:hypothetical protein ACFSHT_24095 [Paraburkholderia silviterrae]|uniref:Uncharacterized protein n=1 Tax=Paraburkholderia silviterrae TaxID=2528715 RepID=A0A4R5MB76_9BURK|nr:hypothetical protein [Paraburkholderia silviterrae]TDG24041.1 hypothetical protein EYW47_11045 [Paraburkholderia silviterrae]